MPDQRAITENNINVVEHCSKTTKEKPKIKECHIKARYVLIFMLFLAKTTMYSLRSNLSVAIVAMVNRTSTEKNMTIISNSSSICASDESFDSQKSGKNGELEWNSAQEGLVLGAYFYGYAFSSIVGGIIAKKCGIKLATGIALLLSSFITISSPIIATTNVILFVIARILLGAMHGPISPSIYVAVSDWIPPLERTRAITTAGAGAAVGKLITLPLAGAIADSFGWEFVFYITGGLGVLFSVVWFVIIHNTPRKHPRISKEERLYIEITAGTDRRTDTSEVKIPWKSFATSLPLWSIISAQFASEWGYTTHLSLLPLYLSSVLGLNLSLSGILSALPYVLQALVTMVGGSVSDFVRQRNWFETVTVRKFVAFLTLVVPSVFIVLAGYIGCNITAAIIFFCISVSFLAFGISGHETNIMDIAPQHGGVIYGIVNAVGYIPGFLAPQIAGVLLLGEATIVNWQSVFWLTAGIGIVAFLVYAIFASGVEQNWAKSQSESTSTESSSQADTN